MCQSCTPPSGLPIRGHFTTRLDYGYLRLLPDNCTSSDVAHYRPRLASSYNISPNVSFHDEVHPLFQQSQWMNLSPAKYKLLGPSLIIATRLLNQDCLLNFHNHVLHGNLKYHPEKQKYYLDKSVLEATSCAYGMTREVLNNILPKSMRLTIEDLDEKDVQYDVMTYCSAIPQGRTFDPRIKIHSHHIYDMCHVILYGSRHDLEAITMRIAVALCHEVAHVVWYYRRCRETTTTETTTHEDPLYEVADAVAELGHAWERYAFGGSIWTIDYPGHITTYYAPLGAWSGRQDENTRIIVPRWWIHAFFLQSTWTNFSRLHHERLLRLPTEVESGCVFRKHLPPSSLDWHMYIHGVKQQQACTMTRSVPFLLWNILSPALECPKAGKHLQDLEKSGQGRKKYQKACSLLIDAALNNLPSAVAPPVSEVRELVSKTESTEDSQAIVSPRRYFS